MTWQSVGRSKPPASSSSTRTEADRALGSEGQVDKPIDKNCGRCCTVATRDWDIGVSRIPVDGCLRALFGRAILLKNPTCVIDRFVHASRIEPLFPKEPVPASPTEWTAAVTAFDRPIGPLIMAACATNNLICLPQPASRWIVPGR
jgi:hypothetical protein